jgi:hypothetical protein
MAGIYLFFQTARLSSNSQPSTINHQLFRWSPLTRHFVYAQLEHDRKSRENSSRWIADPTLLALVSRAAPAKVNATLMGLAFMSLFISNNLIGWIGGFYEKMTPAEFWAMHAAIAAGGGLFVVLFGRRLSRALHPARRVDQLSP